MEGFLNTVFVIGVIYFLISWSRRGEENKRLKDREMALLLEACEKGNGQSCFEIGREYRWEKGYFGYDLNKALEFSIKGCECGSYMACWQAGDILSNKDFRGYDVDKAIQAYEKSIKLGNSLAIDSLAKLYINIKKDTLKAAKVLSKGCDDGEDFSCGRVIGFFGAEIDSNNRNSILRYYNQTHPEKCKECRFMKKYI